MSKFVKRDEVILLRDLKSYRGPNIPVGTRGTIVTLDVDSSIVYYVNFDGYGVRRVREDSLSLASKDNIDIIGDFYMKIKNEEYIYHLIQPLRQELSTLLHCSKTLYITIQQLLYSGKMELRLLLSATARNTILKKGSLWRYAKKSLVIKETIITLSRSGCLKK